MFESKGAVGVSETEDVVGVEERRGFCCDLSTGQEKLAFGLGGNALVGCARFEVETFGGDGFGGEEMLVYDESYLGRERE